MTYRNTLNATFQSRPNRFIAHVEVDGKTVIAHVKNTGRCKELLVSGAKVILQKFDDTRRKTAYDLVAVYKGERLINMDSQAPNKVFFEYLKSGKYIDGITLVKPETKYGDSRFDFYVEAGQQKIFKITTSAAHRTRICAYTQTHHQFYKVSSLDGILREKSP